MSHRSRSTVRPGTVTSGHQDRASAPFPAVVKRLILSFSLLTTALSLVFLYRSAAGLLDGGSGATVRRDDQGIILASPSTTSLNETSGSVAPAASTSTPTEPGSGGTSAVTQTTASPAAEEAISSDVLRRVNHERAAAGVGTLRSDPVLARFAAAWAEEMASSGYRHSSTERLRQIIDEAGLASVSENIHAPEPQCPLGTSCDDAASQPTSGVLHVDWMHSESHRTTAMHPVWSRAGVGVHCDSSGRLWAVVLFGSDPGTVRDHTFVAPPRDLVDPGNDGFLCAGGSRVSNPSWRHTPVS